MKVIGIHISALLLLTATLAAQSPSKANQEIASIETSYLDAVTKNDAAFLEKHLSPEYLGVDNDGHLSTFAEIMNARKTGSLNVHSYKLGKQSIRVTGDIGIVTECLSLSLVKDGQELNGDFQVSRVWKKSDGQWKAVFFQSTRSVQACQLH
jgi:ketosteroid isomerase-like protein